MGFNTLFRRAQRLNDAEVGLLKYREIDKPIFDPAMAGSVAKDPFINGELNEN